MPWSNQGGGWKGNNGGPWGSPPPGQGGGGSPGGPSPDLEEILRKSQERVRDMMPGGSGFGGKGFLLIVLVVLGAWVLLSSVYRVQPDEQGVVLRFGEYVEQTPPGLHFHLPWPIETALTPKVTRVNRIEVGMRGFEDRGSNSRIQDVPEESLMLTGDENIVDVDFTVFWVISSAGDFLFNIQNPESTVKAVAESAMREVIGKSELEPVLTDRRQTEVAVQELMQSTLDDYGAGISVTQVQMQSVDPPNQVIDAFRDVQAARADQERLQNEAQTYANRVVPEARGEAARILEAANGYRDRTVAEARGQADRFSKVYGEYQKAPQVTRERMYLETMERIFGGTEKIIIDDNVGGEGGVLPYLPLNELSRGRNSQ
ncbi:FtsH protease activity modulator HflK [Tepidamorphus sp. 3E244]|uniref:FtsH protease activity modulator HflK n=1 Tax=Tepidamorphus sp. 3E244 TaxID=3385498 RepID=UPI0038FCC319